VLALVREPPEGGAYRDAPPIAVRIIAGRKDEIVARAHAAAADACAVGIATMIVPLAPLLGAWIAGF
jgi:hypothetical protein